MGRSHFAFPQIHSTEQGTQQQAPWGHLTSSSVAATPCERHTHKAHNSPWPQRAEAPELSPRGAGAQLVP